VPKFPGRAASDMHSRVSLSIVRTTSVLTFGFEYCDQRSHSSFHPAHRHVPRAGQPPVVVAVAYLDDEVISR
jgi:hypothetical protein